MLLDVSGNIQQDDNRGEIVLYQPDTSIRLEVLLKSETVWLTQQQISVLFGVKQPAISKHIKNIYSSGELEQEGTYSILEYMGNDGKQSYSVKYYNLDMILSVGYRVGNRNAVLFRRWASMILKDYLLRGYSINTEMTSMQRQIDSRFGTQQQQIQKIQETLAEHKEKIDFFVRTHQPPIERVFVDGSFFDAYDYFSSLIRTAKERVILVDGYVDERDLVLLSKREAGVLATVYSRYNEHFCSDLERFNRQYPPINYIQFRNPVHDRFLIIDGVVYMIGTSLKDAGRQLFAVIRTNFDVDVILNNI